MYGWSFNGITVFSLLWVNILPALVSIDTRLSCFMATPGSVYSDSVNIGLYWTARDWVREANIAVSLNCGTQRELYVISPFFKGLADLKSKVIFTVLYISASRNLMIRCYIARQTSTPILYEVNIVHDKCLCSVLFRYWLILAVS